MSLPVPTEELHFTTIPSRFTNLSNAFEFAGWGSSYKISLTRGDYEIGAAKIAEKRNEKILGQFLTSALVTPRRLVSPYNSFASNYSVNEMSSPISLLTATLVLFIWRPIMEELGSALPMSGAPYISAGKLNTFAKSIAIIGASLLLLDFASTAVMGKMVVLILAASVKWRRMGIDQLKSNWIQGAVILKQIYYGICLGMLRLTGVPSYIARIKPRKFPLVMRNLHLPTIFLNAFLMLLILALVPLEKIQGGANVLSVLAESSGILSACELFAQLVRDRVLTEAFLRSGAPYISTISFAVFCRAIYASASARLDVVSQMFSLVWFTVMSLFPISLLLLKFNTFNRGRLLRKTETRLRSIFLTLAILPPVISGNITLDCRAARSFISLLSVGIPVFFFTTQNKVRILRYYWLYDQFPAMHEKKIAHFYGNEEGVPSELEANARVLDEVFHGITIDFGEFTPESVAALAHRLNIPVSLIFIGFSWTFRGLNPGPYTNIWICRSTVPCKAYALPLR
ncbi:hypothetical protein M378DRAFT_186176 [Amanita muscaria Koide BX008]|uniref:Uncharacterized protein n=1 Tax=Amanita muscaria (strain Koide BX008) TaxID=946122 RepID=A0A0C2X9V1_AMAMK|nr:hypothetical protein M378DRAFT_186176 [Amanita muscaria Koide BX008]